MSRTHTAPLAPGLGNPVHDAQAIFRAVMTALSEPCQPRTVDGSVLPAPPLPLNPVAAAVALTLFDFETPVFLDGALRRNDDVVGYLRFHTGAPLVDHPDQSQFAIIADVARCPRLSSFRQGTAEYPDESTTLILQVSRMAGTGPVFEGPGLARPAAFETVPEIQDFRDQWSCNRSKFPLGVDLIFAGLNTIAGLPRSLRPMES